MIVELKPEDRELVDSELIWIAGRIRGKYPKSNYRDINRVIRKRLALTV